MKVSLVRGQTYSADLSLSFWEKGAGNARVEEKLTAAGFVDVQVTGIGSRRLATGRWDGATGNYDLPSEVENVR